MWEIIAEMKDWVRKKGRAEEPIPTCQKIGNAEFKFQAPKPFSPPILRPFYLSTVATDGHSGGFARRSRGDRQSSNVFPKANLR
jgi:hypothetical protein